MIRKIKFWILVLSLTALFAASLGVRRHILEIQRDMAEGNLPFTLEGAIHFHRVQQLVTQGRLPAVDHGIEFPRGIRISATDTVTDTHLTAALTHLFLPSVPLAERVRWIEGLWFCLGIPLLALWIRLASGSWWGGLTAAAFYGLSLAGVIRSTGQEISHENFAIPLVIASLAAAAWALRAGLRRGFLVGALLSATLLALAQMTWDLVQFFIFIWALWLGWRAVFGRAALTTREAALAWLQVFALVFAGAANPYLRSHGYLYSLPVLMAVGALLANGARKFFQGLENPSAPVSKRWKTRILLLLLMLVPVSIGLLAAHNYGSSYSHFGELLVAKLRFLNVKPDDPSLLTFNQRILWVPALHSATWSLTFHLFPAIFAASLIALACLARRKDEDRNSNLSLLVIACCVSFTGYWYFVRLHVFTVLFLAALLGVWAAWAQRRGPWVRALVGVTLFLALVVETGNTVRRPEEQGRLGVYYRELNELTDWLRRNVAPEPVLANFGVSAAIVAYGGCPVLLHPKFETPRIRERVQKYGEVLFKGTEAQFRDWAELEGASYYVHSLGEFANVGQTQQMRYMVDALQPRGDAPAWLFERAPKQLRLFTQVWSNGKYRVFLIHRTDDAQLAAEQAEAAEQSLRDGQFARAERLALHALNRAPDNVRAQSVLRRVTALPKQVLGAADDKK